MTAVARTLADPMFASIFNPDVVEPYDADAVRQALINHGEKIMSTQAQIQCTTTEEHSHPVEESASLGHQSSLCESTQNQPQTIQGVSGASYAPMDTNPTTPEQQSNIKINLAIMDMTRSLENLVNALRTAENPQANLEEAVSTTLEQADWFRERLSDEISECVEEKDFDYEIGNAVEREMRNFDPNDYVDFHDLVADAVADKIDEIVADAVEERLADILEEKLANAKITINF